MIAPSIQTILSSPVFRAYSSTDVEGTEVVGALKNVLSIGCGMCKGLGYGPNTQVR
jgi:glycerol-3-phosphate dehydrogenase (NAD(P)+)